MSPRPKAVSCSVVPGGGRNPLRPSGRDGQTGLDPPSAGEQGQEGRGGLQDPAAVGLGVTGPAAARRFVAAQVEPQQGRFADNACIAPHNRMGGPAVQPRFDLRQQLLCPRLRAEHPRQEQPLVFTARAETARLPATDAEPTTSSLSVLNREALKN